jgi:hypothetical protein
VAIDFVAFYLGESLGCKDEDGHATANEDGEEWEMHEEILKLNTPWG